MSAVALGRAISDATKFLRGIHDDLRCQIRSLDRLMADRGWKPAEPNRIGWELGNSLNVETKWVSDFLQRAYVPEDSQLTADRVIVVIWYLYFDDGDLHEGPTMAAVAARLGSSQGFTYLPGPKWYIGAIYPAAGTATEPVTLTLEQVSSFLPAAVAGAALVVPLCEMTNEGVLFSRLVGPMLTAEAQIGTLGGPVSTGD